MNYAFLAPFAALLASSALAYEGPSFNATVWRGETAYFKVPDNLAGEVVCREAKDGVSCDLYRMGRVPYAMQRHSPFLSFRYDRLTDAAVDAKPAVSGPTYCKVSVSAEAKPGTYALGALELRVLDRVLPPPAEWKYFLDLWQHPWAVARYFDVEPFSKEHYDRMRPVWETLAACGQKALTTTILDLPWNHQCYDAYHSMIGRKKVKVAGGGEEWRFDYSVFDAYVAFGRRCGIGPDIACYTMCPWGYVVRWENEKGEVQRATAKPGTPVFEDFWRAFLVDFARHLKEKGWFEDTYIAMDERSPEDVRAISSFIRKTVPGLKIAMAGNRKASDFEGITIDNYCQGLTHLSDDCFADLPARRAKGFKTTYYVCCEPSRPNTFMTSEDNEAFWLGLYPSLSGFDGFLRWAANSWPQEPSADAAFGNWAPGDTFLIYPDGMPSSRLIALRAGIIAAEKARLLNAEGKLDGELKKFNEKYGFRKAMNGQVNHDQVRREIEQLVNR